MNPAAEHHREIAKALRMNGYVCLERPDLLKISEGRLISKMGELLMAVANVHDELAEVYTKLEEHGD